MIDYDRYLFLEKSYPQAHPDRVVETALASAVDRGIEGKGAAYSWLNARFQADEVAVERGDLRNPTYVPTEEEFLKAVM